MTTSHAPDEGLIQRLPSPLAQLYRRAVNAKTAQDRHHHAYYLAEAALKLAACLRIGIALRHGLEPGSPLAQSLEKLCLPSVGQWVGFLRETSEYLRKRPDAGLLPLADSHEQLLQHTAFPAVQAFAERASRGSPDEHPALTPEQARDAARQGVIGFFNLMAAYRNQVFGHGAQRLPAFYDEFGHLLLDAVCEVLRQESLFGNLSLAVARLSTDSWSQTVPFERRGADGAARQRESADGSGSVEQVEWQGLRGPVSLVLGLDSAGPEPEAVSSARTVPGQVYFVGSGVRIALHPLVVYLEDRYERERIGFLNRTVTRRVGGTEAEAVEEVRRCEYLDYNTGDQLKEIDVRHELTGLLARLRGQPVGDSVVERLIQESQAEPHEVEPALGAGMVIGDFELEGELGRGGMGVVYQARQRSLNRRVALKVLPPAMAADPVSLARFRREIAALARCEHPNLVKILTSGSDRDRHYYAMELVEGTNLGELFRVLAAWRRQGGRVLQESDLTAALSSSSDKAQRRREADDAEPLPEMESIPAPPSPTIGRGRALYYRLAELFASAAEALAHLHARGILHRDLKPENLMLTADGSRLVVMDLGLAQLKDRTQSLTRTGTRWLGTLRYCSPEQLQRNLLDVDERADVYGMGATLYEMTTLAPLFDGDTEARVIEQVLHHDPSSPRKLDAAVPRDLAAVVMGCLDKDRTRRYASARDLADDLRRFQDGRPVRARPVSTLQRVERWCRRRPVEAALSALLVVTFTAGLTGIILKWREAVKKEGERALEAKRANDSAEKERFAKQAAQNAAANEKLAADKEREAKAVALNRLTQIEKANELLESLFKDIDPHSEEKGGSGLLAQLTKRLVVVADKLDEAAIGDPKSVARMQTFLGNTLNALGDPAKAIELHAKVWAARQRLLGSDHRDTLTSMNDLAQAYLSDGQLAKALPLFEESLAKRTASLGSDDPDTLTSMSRLAGAYVEVGQLSKALPLYEEALTKMKAKFGPDDPKTLLAIHDLAAAYHRAGQFTKALPLFEETLAKEKVVFGPSYIETLSCMNDLANSYRDAGHLDKALPLFEEVWEQAKAKLGSDNPYTLFSMNNLAGAYRANGQSAKAVPLFEEALARMKAKLSPDHPSLMNCMNDLANAYDDAGQISKALPLFEETLRKRKVKLGSDHPDTLISMCNLGDAYAVSGQLAKAIPLYEEALAKLKAKLGANHGATTNCMNNLANAYRMSGQPAKALPLIEETVALNKASLGADHPATLVAMGNLANVYVAAEQPAKAVPLLEELLPKMKTKFGADHPKTLTIMNNLAFTYNAAGQPAKAAALFEETLALSKVKFGPDHPNTLRYTYSLARVYQAAGQLAKALALLEETLAKSKAKLGPDHPDTLKYMNQLALAYQQAGQISKALPLFEESLAKRKVKLGPDHADTLASMFNLASAYLDAKEQDKAIPIFDEFLAAKRKQLGAADPLLASELAATARQLIAHEQYARADALLRECLGIGTKADPDGWGTFNAKALLGGSLLGQKKYAEAEPLLKEGYEGMKARETTIPVLSKPRLTEALERLVKLYDAWGKKDTADEWRKKLNQAKAATKS